MLKEDIIKKEESGSEEIADMIFIGGEMKKKRNILNISEDLINVVNEFIRIAKEKGFEENSCKNKDRILADFIFVDWKELCLGVCFICFICFIMKYDLKG